MIIKFKKETELEIDFLIETFQADSEIKFKKISESEILFGSGAHCFVTPEFWAAVEIVEN